MTVLHFHELLCKTRKSVTLKISLIMTWNILDSLKSHPPPPLISSSFYWFILLTGGPPFKRIKRGLSSTPFFIYQRVIFIKTFERGHSALIPYGAEVLLFQSKWSTKMNWFKPTFGFEMNFLWRALLSLSTTGRESKLYSSKLFK